MIEMTRTQARMFAKEKWGKHPDSKDGLYSLNPKDTMPEFNILVVEDDQIFFKFKWWK